MHESGWPDPDDPDDEPGSHTTLRPVYADQAADYMDRIFSRIQGSPGPASRPAAPPQAAPPTPAEPVESASLLDDLNDMGWFDK